MAAAKPRGLNGAPVFAANHVLLGYVPGTPFGYQRDLPVTVDIRMEELTRQTEYETTDHRKVTRPLDFAITIGVWRPDGTDLVASGRDPALLADHQRMRYANGFDRDTVAQLAGLIPRHLNAMRPGCAHQADDLTADTGLDSPACPKTGYRWGSAWLVEELPPGFLDQVKRLFRNADRSKIWDAEPVLEFRAWTGTADALYAGPSYDDAFAAIRAAADGLTAAIGSADAQAAGVSHPYGVHIQVVTRDDGEDVTQDFLINNPDKPLEMRAPTAQSDQHPSVIAGHDQPADHPADIHNPGNTIDEPGNQAQNQTHVRNTPRSGRRAS